MRAARALRPAACLAVAVVLALLAWAPSARAQRLRAPSIDAPAAILVEPATGDIVFARNADERRPIASTTKLMTALLTLERADLRDTFTTIAYAAGPAESLGGFRGGERVTVRDLLRSLLLASANDAAATLAVRVGGSRARFVRLMNARARALGLANTHFANPIGLDDPQNYSTAEDLVKLTLILRRFAFFRQTTDLRRVTITSGDMPRTYTNRNTVVRDYAPANGVKTGHTSLAGYVLVGSATRRGITVVSAVLGDGSEAERDSDTIKLLRYGLRSYRLAAVLQKGRTLAHARLTHRDEEVALVAGKGLRRTARRGERFDVRVTGAPSQLDGPLPRGARVGTVVVRKRGAVIARLPLVTAAEVVPATTWERVGDWTGRNTAPIVLAAAALASLCVLLGLRRRAVRRRRRSRTKGATVA